MYAYDYIVSILGLKKRKAPARENWVEYADFSEGIPVRFFSDANLLIIVMLIFSYFSIYCFMVVQFCVVYRVARYVGTYLDRRNEKEHTPQMLVNAIQRHHNQSFKEMLMAEPALIDCVYQKKTLLSWAKHYNNIEAHKLLLILMKEKINQKDST